MSLRVWVLEKQTRTRKPNGYEVYLIKKPAGIEFNLYPHPNRTKTHQISGTHSYRGMRVSSRSTLPRAFSSAMGKMEQLRATFTVHPFSSLSHPLSIYHSISRHPFIQSHGSISSQKKKKSHGSIE